jgi:hypothetical protein
MDTSSIKAKEKDASSIKEATTVSANHHTDADILFALQNYVPDTTEEKRLVRKIDFVLLPILWWMYILAHLDRSNIANANAAGMSEDLGLSDNRSSNIHVLRHSILT